MSKNRQRRHLTFIESLLVFYNAVLEVRGIPVQLVKIIPNRLPVIRSQTHQLHPRAISTEERVNLTKCRGYDATGRDCLRA